MTGKTIKERVDEKFSEIDKTKRGDKKMRKKYHIEMNSYLMDSEANVVDKDEAIAVYHRMKESKFYFKGLLSDNETGEVYADFLYTAGLDGLTFKEWYASEEWLKNSDE
jgi:hypothetical protein